MIKLIAFDFVGVLVRENDFELSEVEAQIERLFGPNKFHEDFLNKANKFVPEIAEINIIVNNIINNIYDIREEKLITNLRKKYKDIKIVIATNHIGAIKDYIHKNFNNVDEIFISEIINEIKPDESFYKHILSVMNISPSEMLFLDDNMDNIEGAKKLGINTIKVEKIMNLEEEIDNYLVK